MLYTIEVRDKNNKLYKDKNGKRVIKFSFEDSETNESLIHLICEDTFNKYNALTGSKNIYINVSELSNLTGTYSSRYSFYGAEKRFVKHT